MANVYELFVVSNVGLPFAILFGVASDVCYDNVGPLSTQLLNFLVEVNVDSVTVMKGWEILLIGFTDAYI